MDPGTRKGLVMAGGSGSRLSPSSLAITKHLFPIYNKPMIFYPLAVLLECGVREVCLICSPADLANYKRLLRDGSQWGISLSYLVQHQPRGIAEGLVLAADFLANTPCLLILGDNIFHGGGILASLKRANERQDGATIFGYRVHDPERYGVAEFGRDGKVVRIVEKPRHPPSKIAVTGLYSYDAQVSRYASELRPSRRGELEITDLNNRYLEQGTLEMEIIGPGNAWLDTGTHESLLEASEFVRAVEHRQGISVACLEEVAFRNGLIGRSKIEEAISHYGQGGYVEYLRSLLDGD